MATWLRKHIPKIVLTLVTLLCYITIKNVSLIPTPGKIESVQNIHAQGQLPEESSNVQRRNSGADAKSDKEVINSKVSSHTNMSEKNKVSMSKSNVDDKCINKWLGVPKSIANSGDADNYKDVTCSALLFGNGTQPVYDKARKFMNAAKKKLHSDSYFQELIQDEGCMEFKLRRGYHLNPADPEEVDYPIGYNILIHRDLEQVEELLRSIYRPQNSYCIHVDGKVSSKIMESIRAIASCFQNVFLASRLEKIVYAGYSRLQADINCMKDQMKSPVKWKYLLNTAGQGFPIQTNLEMVKMLKIYNGANDVEGIYGARVHRSRFENEWKEDLKSGKLNKTQKKNPKPPYDIDIVRGSAYGVFSRDFVDWLLNDEKPRALLEWSKLTWSPDEHYWATLHHTYSNPHLHPPGGYAGIPNEKPWLAVWVAWGGVDKCNGRWQRGTCLFGVGDLPAIIKRREFMVNKFGVDFQYLAQECLARYIEYKVDCPPEFDEQYYKKLPFIKH